MTSSVVLLKTCFAPACANTLFLRDSNHPLSVYSNVETTFIDGEIFFDRQRDLAMREQKQKERAELERAEPNTLTRPVSRPVPAVVPNDGGSR